MADDERPQIEPILSVFAKGSAKNAFPLSVGSLKGSSSSCVKTVATKRAMISFSNITVPAKEGKLVRIRNFEKTRKIEKVPVAA